MSVSDHELLRNYASGGPEAEASFTVLVSRHLKDRIKDFLTQRPAWNIPELKLLSEQHWSNAASAATLETEEEFRRATARRLRDRAVGLASNRISQALNAYVSAHSGRLPDQPQQLAPYCDPPLDLTILARYQMLHTGLASSVPSTDAIRIIAPKAPADVEFDTNYYIGTTGYGNNGVAMSVNIHDAQRDFARAHGGRGTVNANELLPFLKWPASAEAVQKHIESRSQMPGAAR